MSTPSLNSNNNLGVYAYWSRLQPTPQTAPAPTTGSVLSQSILASQALDQATYGAGFSNSDPRSKSLIQPDETIAFGAVLDAETKRQNKRR